MSLANDNPSCYSSPSSHLERLQKVYDDLRTSDDSPVLKDIAAVERRQKPKKSFPDDKFSFDHGREFLSRITVAGEKLLRDFDKLGLKEQVDIEISVLRFKIAALMHTIGLKEVVKNSDIRSAELAKRYLQRYLKNGDIDKSDVDVITHAIQNYSKGEHLSNLVDVALLLANKLDTTNRRVIRVREGLPYAASKMKMIDFHVKPFERNGVRRLAVILEFVSSETDLKKAKDLCRRLERDVTLPVENAAKFIGAKKYVVNVKNSSIKYRNYPPRKSEKR